MLNGKLHELIHLKHPYRPCSATALVPLVTSSSCFTSRDDFDEQLMQDEEIFRRVSDSICLANSKKNLAFLSFATSY